MAIEKYLRDYEAGEIIFDQNAPGDAMYVIKEGKVRIEVTIEVNSQKINKSLGEITTGDFFGEMAIIDNSPRTARAIAMEKTQLILLNHNRFYKLIESSPEFAIKIVRKISTRLKEANDRMQNLVSVKKKSQIIQFLLETMDKKKTQTFSIVDFYENTLVDETFKEEDILGVLHKLEKANILEIKKDKEIHIKNLEDLKKILYFMSIFEQDK